MNINKINRISLRLLFSPHQRYPCWKQWEFTMAMFCLIGTMRQSKTSKIGPINSSVLSVFQNICHANTCSARQQCLIFRSLWKVLVDRFLIPLSLCISVKTSAYCGDHSTRSTLFHLDLTLPMNCILWFKVKLCERNISSTIVTFPVYLMWRVRLF